MTTEPTPPTTPLAVVKLGGGLITDKQSLCTSDDTAIMQCAVTVSGLVDAGYAVTVVHGAGSFGHLRAQSWRLSEGRLQPQRSRPQRLWYPAERVPDGTLDDVGDASEPGITNQ
eukprot:gene12006-10365_t